MGTGRSWRYAPVGSGAVIAALAVIVGAIVLGLINTNTEGVFLADLVANVRIADLIVPALIAGSVWALALGVRAANRPSVKALTEKREVEPQGLREQIRPTPGATLIGCPVCRREVSSAAPTCPGCGHPLALPVGATPIPGSLEAQWAAVPWYRQSPTASVLCVLGLICGLPLLFVSVILATGDVYYKKLDDRGRLKPWHAANKVVAVVILLGWSWFVLSQWTGMATRGSPTEGPQESASLPTSSAPRGARQPLQQPSPAPAVDDQTAEDGPAKLPIEFGTSRAAARRRFGSVYASEHQLPPIFADGDAAAGLGSRAFDSFGEVGLIVEYQDGMVSKITATRLASGATYRERVLRVGIGDSLARCKAVWGEPSSRRAGLGYAVLEWQYDRYHIEIELWTDTHDEPSFGHVVADTVKQINVEGRADVRHDVEPVIAPRRAPASEHKIQVPSRAAPPTPELPPPQPEPAPPAPPPAPPPGAPAPWGPRPLTPDNPFG